VIVNVGKAITKYPNENWRDALSENQIKSKEWLINKLDYCFGGTGNVVVVGSWLGVLPLLMFNNDLSVGKCYGIDLDPNMMEISEFLVNEWRYKGLAVNAINLDYEPLDIDTYINTATEHFSPAGFEHWYLNIPWGSRVAVQSTDLKHEEHIHTVHNLDDFLHRSPMSHVEYAETLKMSEANCTRFMVIGTK